MASNKVELNLNIKAKKAKAKGKDKIILAKYISILCLHFFIFKKGSYVINILLKICLFIFSLFSLFSIFSLSIFL